MRIIAMTISLLFCSYEFCLAQTYENLSIFTVYDQDSDFTINGTHITVSTMDRCSDSNVYKAYGTNYFNPSSEITHEFEVNTSQPTVGKEWTDGVIWGLTNHTNQSADKWTDGYFVTVEAVDHSGVGSGPYYPRIYLYNVESGDSEESHQSNLEYDKNYYLTTNINSTNATCKIYNDSDKTDLVATLEVNYNGSTWENLYVTTGYDEDALCDRSISYVAGNYDLNEAQEIGETMQIIFID